VTSPGPWTYEQALAWLEAHVNLEAGTTWPEPDLGRMRQLCRLMGDPQSAYPVIHLTGTNGKGSTTRMITALLAARGLTVGTYTSPDLEAVNERLAVTSGRISAFEDDTDRGGGDEDDPGEDGSGAPTADAGGPARGRPDRIGDPPVDDPADGVAGARPPETEPIADGDLAAVLQAVAGLEELLDRPVTRFEILTAAAFRWFADIAVDVAVVEVGLGGRHDATNVAVADVAVVTNVSLDHEDIIGPRLEDIAREKAGIVEPGCTLVLGEVGDLLPVFREAGAAKVWELGRHFGVTADRAAVGGRLVTLRTPGGAYDDVFLPVHGAHQATNAALAVAAVEAFFEEPPAPEVVGEGFAGLRLPGRMEVVGRHPLVLLDGAHNAAGARAAGATLTEEFAGDGGLIAVVGMLRGRDPEEMLRSLGLAGARLVVGCPAPSPRTRPASDVVAAARALGVEAVVAGSVAEAVDTALAAAGEEDRVLITGSLYVVGAARTALRARGADVGDQGRQR